MKSRLPSGANVKRRKKDVKVSLAYMPVLREGMFRPPPMLGDAEGITAGRGIDGLGETERRIDWFETETEPKDERRL